MKVLTVNSNEKGRALPVATAIIPVLLLGAVAGLAFWGNSVNGKVLTYNLSEPLDGTTTAKVDINTGIGNLAIDGHTSGEQVLANGTLQYLQGQGLPTRSVNTNNGVTTFMLKASDPGQPRFRLPWTACNGETEWQVHLNPSVQSDLRAHSGGGNVRLNLAGTSVSQVSADTGGGNIDVVLPDKAANLSVTAKTGAGNVTIEISSSTAGNNTVNAKSGAGNVIVKVPIGMAARIHVATGLGKAIVDSQFSKIDSTTYQSPDYDSAANKVEITLNSGAGNISITTK